MTGRDIGSAARELREPLARRLDCRPATSSTSAARHGTEIERPLAIVMIGGLLTSTLFTLLALPACYALMHRLQLRLAQRRARREAPAEPPAEAP